MRNNNASRSGTLLPAAAARNAATIQDAPGKLSPPTQQAPGSSLPPEACGSAGVPPPQLQTYQQHRQRQQQGLLLMMQQQAAGSCGGGAAAINLQPRTCGAYSGFPARYANTHRAHHFREQARPAPFFPHRQQQHPPRPPQMMMSTTRRSIRASPFEPLVVDRNLPKEGTITPLKFDEYCAAGDDAPAAANNSSNSDGATCGRDDVDQNDVDDDEEGRFCCGTGSGESDYEVFPGEEDHAEHDDDDYDDDVHHDHNLEDDDTIASISSHNAPPPPPMAEVNVPLAEVASQGLVELSKDDWKALYASSRVELDASKRHADDVAEENRLLKRKLIEMQKTLFEARRNRRPLCLLPDGGKDAEKMLPETPRWTIPEYTNKRHRSPSLSATSSSSSSSPSNNKRRKVVLVVTESSSSSSSAAAANGDDSSSNKKAKVAIQEPTAPSVSTTDEVLPSVSHDEGCAAADKVRREAQQQKQPQGSASS